MNITLIKNWVIANNPQGKEKLAVKAQVSSALVYKLLRTGKPTGVEIARRISRVIGVSLDELCGEEDKTA